MKLKIALLQAEAKIGDQKFNLEKGIELCRKAKEGGAHLALFPEMWNIAYQLCPIDEKGMRDWENLAIDESSEFFQTFVELAKELKMYIAITYLKKTDAKPENSVSVINPSGKVVLDYSKIFNCDFGIEEFQKENPDMNEIGSDHNTQPGKKADVGMLEIEGETIKIGALICADREFPEVASIYGKAEVDLIIAPNSCTWDPMRTVILKTRAFENLCAIAMTNYPKSTASGLSVTNGHSMIVNPVVWDKSGNYKDSIIFEAGEEERIFVVEVDIDEFRDFRKAESWRMEKRGKFSVS